MILPRILNKPYPINLNRWGITIFISIFVAVFLVFFQPFGLQHLQLEHKNILLAGYGGITFLVLFLNLFIIPIFLPFLFNEDNWTVAKQILWLCWIVLSIGTGNYFYSILVNTYQWSGINGLISFIIFTFSIAIIPIVVVTILSHNRMLRNNLMIAEEMNANIESNPNTETADFYIKIQSENKTQLKTSALNLICIESEGNYIRVTFLEKDAVNHKVLRSTLKNVEFQVQDVKELYKCHRAFIINISYIEKVKGNSQGYRLVMKHLENEIPVSRNNSKALKELIKEF